METKYNQYKITLYLKYQILLIFKSNVMNSIVSITLSGNLTKDATFKAYEDKGVINFSFAVNEPVEKTR